jgi:O-methyltransferase involved in polyketide biosynthesis
VLDTAWIDHVTRETNTGFLLLAEGLFCWLPEQDVMRLFGEIGRRFYRSQMILDVVPAKFTRGLWKKLLHFEIKHTWGLDVDWSYGIRDPRELETYSKALKIIAEEKGSAGPIITLAVNDS